MRHTILSIAAMLLLAGCASHRAGETLAAGNETAEASWNAFCAARGYNPSDNTYNAVNEYVDTWCGSAEEERALIRAGIKPD